MTHPILDGVKCVVFDIDDTLYLERDYAKSGFKAVGRWAKDELGVDDFASLAWAKFEAGVRRTVFNEVLYELEIDHDLDLIKEMVRVYRHHEPDIELLLDAANCIDALADDFQLAALTGGPLVCQQAKVCALGIEALLEPIVYARTWGAEYDKPHARSFYKVQSLTKMHGSDCAYLSDNPTKDFTAPQAMGWTTVRVRRPGSLHQAIESGIETDLEVTSLNELVVF
jgi:putative hydrolase of the HAD superfamily